jgi:hypothetical protein
MLRLVVPERDERQGEYTQAERERALEKLGRFLRQGEFVELGYRVGSALWGGAPEHVRDQDIREMMHSPTAQLTFFNYYAFDAELEPGKVALDLYLERHGDTLRPGDRAYLGLMRASHVRLYEVTHIRANEGVTLRDLLTGAEQFVHERSATTQLATWQVIAARLVQGPRGVPVFEAIDCVFPATCREDLVRSLALGWRGAQPFARASDESVFFKRFTPFIQTIWMQRVLFRAMPTLTTTDGDDVAFVKAVFDVHDDARLAAALRASADLHPEDDDRFVWAEGGEDGGRLLGAFVVAPGRLTYEGMSEARAERARTFIADLAGDAVTYRATSVEGAEQAMARLKSARGNKRQERRSEIPADVQASVILEYYEKYYREWLDIPVPALGNRTPRRAAKLKTVRPRLVELLKDMEGSAERSRRAGHPAYDFGWMWGELGISPDSGAGPVIDQRSPQERIEAIAKARSVKRAREMVGDIGREICTAHDVRTWLAAVRAAQGRGVISLDVVCYLAEHFLESTEFAFSVSDPELSRLQEEMTVVERAHGLGENEFWHAGDAPPEWTALNDAWDARRDAFMIEQLREAGQGDLADLWEGKPETFEEMSSVGWAELLGDSRARRK